MNDRTYCDSSLLISLRVRDVNHLAAVDWKNANAEVLPVWTPFHRVEVFNGVRQLAQIGAITQAAAKSIIARVTYDLGFYYEHVDPDWRDVMRSANEISAEIGFSLRVRALDLLHVAHAREVSAGLFVTCDDRQARVAKKAGLKTVLVS